MKMRVPILFLLVVVAGVLVWLLSAAHRTPKSAPEPYWAEQVGEINQLGRYKHAAAARYTDYASTAESEQQTDAAKLFYALARSEQVHEINCADAVRRLGGHYIPPLKVIVFRGRTPDNLARALNDEQLNYDRYRSGSIERSIDAGNLYAARTLIRIAGGDMRHIELLGYFIGHPDSSGYAVCPVCGNLFRTTTCDHYCPFCQTPDTEFDRFE